MPRNILKIFIIGTKNSGLQQIIDYEMSDGFVLDTSHISGVVDLDKIFGQFQDLYPKYLTGAHGMILIVNLGDLKSLEAIQEWISLIRRNRKDIPILLVGDRPKKEQNRQISERDSVQFVKEHKLEGYMEIASYNEFNTSTMFEKITSLILERQNNP